MHCLFFFLCAQLGNDNWLNTEGKIWMRAAENINHIQLNSITYLLSRQTHNKTFLFSRPTNKYITIRGEVGSGGGRGKTHHTGEDFHHHHNMQRTKAALWRAELTKQNDYYREWPLTPSKNKLHSDVALALVLGKRTSKRREIMTASQRLGPAGTVQFAI